MVEDIAVTVTIPGLSVFSPTPSLRPRSHGACKASTTSLRARPRAMVLTYIQMVAALMRPVSRNP